MGRSASKKGFSNCINEFGKLFVDCRVNNEIGKPTIIGVHPSNKQKALRFY